MYAHPSGGWRDAWNVPSTTATDAAIGKATPSTTTTAPPRARARASSSTPASTGTSTPPRPGLGYLAFPGGRPPVLVATGDDATSTSSSGTAGSTGVDGPRGIAGPGPAQPKPAATTTHPKSNSKPDSQRQSSSRSRALEQAEAERGEHEWVACGGMLRDQHGNVDVERTKKVREEVERKEKERVMKARWDAHEEAWKVLSVGGKGKKKATEKVIKDVGFGDVPWPVWAEDEDEGKEKKLTMTISLRGRESCPLRKKKRVTTLEDLTVDRVKDFLFSPLNIRGCTVTPKARIRSSFLRWHPDKLGWLIDRVKDDDVENVKMGIGIVVESLQRMNGALKGS